MMVADGIALYGNTREVEEVGSLAKGVGREV